MKIQWEKSKAKYEYHYGETDSRFSAQIGQSTVKEKLAWMIFHQDFKYCIFGDTANTLTEAKLAVEKWLKENAKIRA